MAGDVGGADLRAVLEGHLEDLIAVDDGRGIDLAALNFAHCLTGIDLVGSTDTRDQTRAQQDEHHRQ